jgi:hypothetical protein
MNGVPHIVAITGSSRAEQQCSHGATGDSAKQQQQSYIQRWMMIGLGSLTHGRSMCWGQSPSAISPWLVGSLILSQDGFCFQLND